MQPSETRLAPAADGRNVRRRRMTVLIVLGFAFPILATVALATPGVGVISGPVHARGTIEEALIINSKSGIHLKTKGSTDLVTQQIVLAGGGNTGWHSHPGPVIVVVKQGTLTYIRADGGVCSSTPYAAGTAFVDPGQGHAHTAFNLGSENLVLMATYFDVPVVPAPC